MKTTICGWVGERRRAVRQVLSPRLLLSCMVVAWAGCKEETKVTPGPDPTGTYALVSVDGNPVPCTVHHGGATLTIGSGSFIIRADGTCASTVAFTVPSRGDTTREVQATYTRQGSKLTMRWKGAGTTTGLVDGDAFTMNNEGMVFAYRK
jgi:hypothetical protein